MLMIEKALTEEEEAIVNGFSPETIERIMTPKNKSKQES